MPVFPSGKRRIMVAQQSPDESRHGVKVGDDAASAFRSQPQQEAITGNQPQNPQQNAAEGEETPEGPYQFPGNNANQQPQQNQQQNAQQQNQQHNSEDQLKNAVFHMLETLGVPTRQLREQPEKIIEIVHDLDTGTVRGFYLIPTYTQGHEVDDTRARQLAAEIGKKFNLSQKLKAGGFNYRVDFQSNVAQDQMGHGTSFDHLFGGGGGQAGGVAQRKAAEVTPSMHEMMKTSKDRLFRTLTKNGQTKE